MRSGGIGNRWVSSGFRGLGIVIVSSSGAVHHATRALLRHRNFRIMATMSNFRTLTGVTRTGPSVIFISVVVPHLSNCRAYTLVGGSRGCRGVPIVVLSDGSNLFSRTGNHIIKSSRCLAGPFDGSRLLGTVQGRMATWIGFC